MKNLILLILIGLLMLASCGDKNNSNSTTKAQTNIEKWYKGGTLHKSTIAEWKVATDKNKLATCADFMAAVDNKVSMDELKKRATALKKCIDEATKDLKSTNNMKVSEIAAACTILLGY